LLPTPYVSLMQRHALDACPVSPYADVARTLEEQLGAPPEATFSEFEMAPFASASLAQVHRAVTRQGEEVAVKVQHRLLKDTAAADMRTIRCGARFGCTQRARSRAGLTCCKALICSADRGAVP
jgi:aarF domain-containing kinase